MNDNRGQNSPTPRDGDGGSGRQRRAATLPGKGSTAKVERPLAAAATLYGPAVASATLAAFVFSLLSLLMGRGVVTASDAPDAEEAAGAT